jgi:hypothetical protein
LPDPAASLCIRMTPADLIAFEEDIAAEFNEAKIRASVHL